MGELMKSIKTKGMVFSLSLILFSIVLLGFSAYYRFRVILVNEVDKAVVRVAEESADNLSNYIDQFITPLVGLSQNEDIRSMDLERQMKVINTQINPTYLNIAVVDMKGVAYYKDGTSLNLIDRDYVKDTLLGKISFSEVIISRKTGTPVIMVGVPISENGIIKGALVARLDVDFLSGYALTRGYGDSGRAYIISSQGTFISRPEQEKSEKEYNLFDIAQNNNEYISFSEFVKESIGNQAGFGDYVSDGERILMGYASVDETNWKIYIGTYEDEVLESLGGLRRMFYSIVIVTLLVCILAAWIFISKFSKSIAELDDLFAQGAKGNLTIRFTPKSKDEIGRVGISFNRMMDKIKTLTQYDPLTALLNQYVLENDIDTLVHSNNNTDFSVIMIAIDKLSFINETYGYTSGDAILYEVARRISRRIAGNQQVYRYKGDQFVVLCQDKLSDTELEELSQNILSDLKESYIVDDKTIDINVNMGTFIRNEDTKSEEPLKAVTQAKNYAKYMGSNQIQKFNQQIYNDLMVMNELQADILRGLKENQFFLVYQPLFYLGNENIAEVEALIRWKHPQKGLLYPDQFIDIAEQAGTIVNIDQWVIETACRQLKTWKDRQKTPVILSVNISAKTFETSSFIPELVDTIKKFDINPALLQMEITERMLIKNVEESINKLNELREMGIHIAIDDFGIGYSSLSYIVRLPIDSIKIDKSFVQNIHTSKEAKTIVSTIINLCKTLKLRVIAEGIESRLELDYLKSNKCDIGQGYYFSKPVSINEIEEKHMEDKAAK